MSTVGDFVGAIGGVAGRTLKLKRFAPEPRSRSGISFGNVLRSLGSEIAGGVGDVSGIDPMYMDLINKQIEVQQQMQLVSFESNIEKSRHETEMAAIRNLRVG